MSIVNVYSALISRNPHCDQCARNMFHKRLKTAAVTLGLFRAPDATQLWVESQLRWSDQDYRHHSGVCSMRSNQQWKKQFQNSFETVLKLFWFSQNKTPWTWKVLAVLANHCRYPLFARQARGGGGGAMTYAWCRRRLQCRAVARYYKTLLFGVTTRVTR